MNRTTARPQVSVTLVVCAFASLCGGCSNNPSAVQFANIDPEEAAKLAVESYDLDSDGLLSEEELSACRAMQRAIKRFDTDGDAQVSSDEIAARIPAWTAGDRSMANLFCRVNLNGRPLSAATIRFIPYEFLQPALKVAQGVTRGNGLAGVFVPDEELPKENQGLKALYMGLYRIEITHPSIPIPAKYNTESTLGDEFMGQYGMTGLTINLTTQKKSKQDGIAETRGNPSTEFVQ